MTIGYYSSDRAYEDAAAIVKKHTKGEPSVFDDLPEFARCEPTSEARRVAVRAIETAVAAGEELWDLSRDMFDDHQPVPELTQQEFDDWVDDWEDEHGEVIPEKVKDHAGPLTDQERGNFAHEIEVDGVARVREKHRLYDDLP